MLQIPCPVRNVKLMIYVAQDWLTLTLAPAAAGSLIQGEEPIHDEEEDDERPNLPADDGELVRGAW